jgi:hypothetical protein
MLTLLRGPRPGHLGPLKHRFFPGIGTKKASPNGMMHICENLLLWFLINMRRHDDDTTCAVGECNDAVLLREYVLFGKSSPLHLCSWGTIECGALPVEQSVWGDVLPSALLHDWFAAIERSMLPCMAVVAESRSEGFPPSLPGEPSEICSWVFSRKTLTWLSALEQSSSWISFPTPSNPGTSMEPSF